MKFKFKDLLAYAGLTLIYLAIGKLGLLLATLNHNSTPIWPATGFAIFALCRWGIKYFPAIFFGAIATNYLSSTPLIPSLFIGLGNMTEAVVGCFIYHHLWKLWRGRYGCHFRPVILLVTSFSGALISSSVGNLTLYFADIIPAESLSNSWLTWLTGDMLGGLVIFPLLQILFNGRWNHIVGEQKLETALSVGFSILIGYLVFLWFPGKSMYFVTFFFALYLMARNLREQAYFSSLIFYIFAILATAKGYGPFFHEDINRSFIFLQLFFACYSLTLITMEEFQSKNVLQFPAIALFVGWMISALVFQGFMKAELDRDNANLDTLIHDGIAKIKANEEVYTAALRATVAFVLVEGEEKHQDWIRFVEQMDLSNKLPGINGIGFIKSIPIKNFEKWKAKHQLEHKGAFKVHSYIGKESRVEKIEKYVISEIEPLERNQPALGLEISSELRRWRAATRARDQRKPVLSEPIVLVQDQQQRKGGIYLLPVFENSKKFLGWVYAPVIFENLMKSGLSAGQNQLGYSIVFNGEKVYSSIVSNAPIEKTTLWHFGEQDFQLQWFKTPQFKSVRDETGMWVVTTALLMALLVSIVIGNMQQVNNYADEVANLATSDLKRSQFQLIHSAKFSALGEMSAGIAHEINNPLAIIMGRAEQIARIAERNPVDIERIVEMSQMIRRTVDRISAIVMGLKSFARSGESLPVTRIEVKTLVEETLVFCKERFRANQIEIRQNIANNLQIEVRQAQISQVLLNLLNNSFDAIQDLSEKWVEISVKVIHERFIELIVTDSGSGIPQETVEKMMQPFFTTKDVGKGTGLGLSISKGIVEDHQGELTYDSHCPNTRFILRLPFSRTNSKEKAA